MVKYKDKVKILKGCWKDCIAIVFDGSILGEALWVKFRVTGKIFPKKMLYSPEELEVIEESTVNNQTQKSVKEQEMRK